MKSSTTFQYLLCATLATSLLSKAFTLVPSRGITIPNSPTIGTSSLSAKKSRRKRKAPKPSEDLPDFELDEDDGALPEFDLGDEDQPVKPAAKKPTETTELNFDEITDNMMGDASAPTASIEALIADRKLESKFVFDKEVEDDTIPDFVDFAAPSTNSEPAAPGSKAERREQRKAAAIARLEAEQQATKFEIPFIQDEKGNISGLKILEAGAWAGIFLLVGWEVYINSPFFDRAAPMAPVVFEGDGRQI
ncbi:unnamed protein product [Cylindrotheca closterium]|uniref:PSI-F n=1 Tax=Cylindrotheca closterium TaxID=2856 RepID=A0AAD2CQM0_9STRA|nr:unnamed protein product [Cylindrotheca closterium]